MTPVRPQAAIYKKRIQKLFRLAGSGAEALLVTGPEDVRYLCGFTGSEGLLLLAADTSIFMTDGRYTTQAAAQVCADQVITFKNKHRELARVAKSYGITKLHVDVRQLTVAQLRQWENALPRIRLDGLADACADLRLIKDSGEVQLLARAADIAARSLAQTLSLIQPGMSEIDVACELEYRMRKNGAAGASFPTIVASGSRSAMPHGIASGKMLVRGEIVLIDYGCVCDGYCSDETCTFFLGEPTPRQRSLYEAVRTAHDLALGALRPGAALKDVDAAAREYLVRKKLGSRFTHGTGHGLGMCVHENPPVSGRSQAVARQGMVVTIEPGIYFPGSMGIRIEDTAVVTSRGHRLLTTTDKALRVIG